MNDVPRHIRQTKIAAGMPVGETLVVESQSMQDCCMQIMHVDGILDRTITILVGRTLSKSPCVTPSRHPHRKCLRMMTPAVPILDHRCATKFGAPDNQRFLQQPPSLQILQ
jgi:hypothetical protein